MGGASYVGSDDALLGHHEDEADEDGRAQHADGAHQRVGPLRLLPAEASGGGSDHHAQQPGHAGDGSEDDAGQEEEEEEEEQVVFQTAHSDGDHDQTDMK